MTEYLSRQEMFDKAICGLIRQGKPAIGEDGNCAYRTPDGCRCAIGMLISDEEYDQAVAEEGTFEGIPFDMLDANIAHVAAGDEAFAAAMQKLHDLPYYKIRQFKLPDELFVPVLYFSAWHFAQAYKLQTNEIEHAYSEWEQDNA